MPEEARPDIRPQLREFLGWYEEVVLGRIESGRSWRQENRSASQKRRQPWLTFSISLTPARTSPPVRRDTRRDSAGLGGERTSRPERSSPRLLAGDEGNPLGSRRPMAEPGDVLGVRQLLPDQRFEFPNLIG